MTIEKYVSGIKHFLGVQSFYLPYISCETYSEASNATVPKNIVMMPSYTQFSLVTTHFVLSNKATLHIE